MRIAVDVDGVLADHVKAVLERLSEEYSDFDRTRASMTHWDEDLPSIDTSLKTEIERAESDSDFVREMKPIEGAIEGTNLLADHGHELVIVTARPEENLSATHDWLDALGIPHNREESKSTNGQLKTIADAAVLIDDFPGHVEDFAESGKYGIIFKQPWNKDQLSELQQSPRIFAAESWDEIPGIIESIEAKKSEFV